MFPPQPYTVPNSISVTNVAELDTALSGAQSDIILEDGTYEKSGYFTNNKGHRIYARNLGGAILKSGFNNGGNSTGPENALYQGLAFDIDDPSKTLLGDAVHCWGFGTGAKIYDTTINGNGVLTSGIRSYACEGFECRRVVVRNARKFGIAVIENTPSTVPVILEDLDIANVLDDPPGSNNGTSEACLWVGDRAHVNRVKLRNAGWMGLWTGAACTDSVFENLDIDDIDHRAKVGIYLERFTIDSVFRNFTIGRKVTTGINCEWDGGVNGPGPASQGTIFEDGLIESTCIGIGLNPGTKDTTARRITFRNQRAAAINDDSRHGTGNLWDTSGNVYLQPGQDITNEWANNLWPLCNQIAPPRRRHANRNSELMFRVFDGLLHNNKPDLGLEPIHVIYGVEYQWTAEDNIANGPTAERLNHVRSLGSQHQGKVVCHDIERWYGTWSHEYMGYSPEDFTIQRDHYLAVTNAFNETFSGEVGHYAYPPGHDYLSHQPPNGPGSARHNNWMMGGDIQKTVLNQCTMIMPSLYMRYDDMDGWYNDANGTLVECRRLDSSKPVYPFLWFEYHSGGPLKGQKIPRDYWRKQLDWCHENCEGLVIWGGYQRQWDERAPWWQETKQFLKTIRYGNYRHAPPRRSHAKRNSQDRTQRRRKYFGFGSGARA